MQKIPSQPALLRPRLANAIGFLIASAVALVFLVVTIGLTHQVWNRMLQQRDAAARFVPVPATILTSEVIRQRSKSGNSYRNAITYSYTADGKTYTSDRIAFDYSSSNYDDAKQIETQNQPGAATTAYIDPLNPSSATLWKSSRESSTRSFGMMLVFLLPCQTISIAIIAAIIIYFRPGCRTHDSATASGFLLRQDDAIAILRLSQFHPLLKALLTIGGTSFLSTFILALTARMQPPFPVSIGVAIACLTLGTIVYFFARFRRDSGRYDLIIDREQRLLLLPPSVLKQAVAASVPFDDVTGITRTSTRGRRGGTYHAVRLTVGISPDSKRYQLASSLQAHQAQALVEFLKHEIGDAPCLTIHESADTDSPL
ncbi:MAG: DUF3592 domain-containing protein [Planctomycetes bacterium]|nr:DUF3592 domain-containing protein [Planctomycetota bacterium]